MSVLFENAVKKNSFSVASVTKNAQNHPKVDESWKLFSIHISVNEIKKLKSLLLKDKSYGAS